MSLYKRPNSRYWWAKIRLPDGGCVCRSSGTTKRQEAQEWLDHTRAGLWRVHRLGERPTYTWQDAVVRWSEEKADKATAREDRVKFQWLDRYLAGRLLHTITRDDDSGHRCRESSGEFTSDRQPLSCSRPCRLEAGRRSVAMDRESAERDAVC